jgi:membrane protein
MKFFRRARRIVRGAMQDNITGEAAKAAYYFFLSLFPMVIALFAFTGIFGGSAAFDRIMAWMNTALPDDATAFLEGFVREITDERRPDALSLGIILTIWSASNFFAALGDGLDTMFDVRDRSSWLKKRLKSLLLMVVGGTLLFTGAVAIVAGPHIAAALGMSSAVQLLTWPLAFVLLVGLLWLTYYILPAHDQSSMKKELLIGAIAGTTVWLAATGVFRFYVGNIANFGRMYGILGGIVILMLWLYLTALAILLGGEVADVLVSEREEAAADAKEAAAGA